VEFSGKKQAELKAGASPQSCNTPFPLEQYLMLQAFTRETVYYRCSWEPY